MYFDGADSANYFAYGPQNAMHSYWPHQVPPASSYMDKDYFAFDDFWHGASQANRLHDGYLNLGQMESSVHQANFLPEEPREIVLVTSLSSGACDSLSADAASADLVAFDAEWAPDRTSASNNPISVLQLAFPTSRRVYVVQLSRLDGKLPRAVSMMLVNPEVTKVGFAVDRGDIVKFARTGIAVTKGSVIDVQELCWKSLGMATPYGRLGLKHAAEEILGFNMYKDKRLSCSDWASDELSPEQVRYAGLDAWVTLRLFCSQYLGG